MWWISTKDKLPNDEEWVLIYCSGHPSPKGIYQARKRTQANNTYYYFALGMSKLITAAEVTHWMTLPPAPSLTNEEKPE